MSPPLLPYERLLTQVDEWFDRARATLLGELPCRRGCCRCCIGPFAITALDVAALTRGMSSLAPDLRRDIQDSARRQAAVMETAFPRLRESPGLNDWSDAEVERVVERFTDLPCPALGSDGSCRVYPFRPATCRMMGIPVEEKALVHGACEVQTAVPVVRLPRVLREEEDRLAAAEASHIQAAPGTRINRAGVRSDDEVLLPYGFLAEGNPDGDTAPQSWTGSRRV